jgi:hypothetical protein
VRLCIYTGLGGILDIKYMKRGILDVNNMKGGIFDILNKKGSRFRYLPWILYSLISTWSMEHRFC